MTSDIIDGPSADDAVAPNATMRCLTADELDSVSGGCDNCKGQCGNPTCPHTTHHTDS